MNYKNIVLFCVGLLITSNSFAIPSLNIDFRDWTGADGNQSHTVGNVTARTANNVVEGDDPDSTDDDFFGRVGSVLSQDSILGMGIQGSQCGTNDFNLDNCEILQVRFDWDAPDSNYFLTGVWLTGLAGPDNDSDPGNHRRVGERALVRLIDLNDPGPDDNVVLVREVGFGSNSNADGEQFISFNGNFRPDIAVFSVPGFFSDNGNALDEYSVVGFTTVPEPDSLALIGLGLLAIRIIRGKKNA